MPLKHKPMFKVRNIEIPYLQAADALGVSSNLLYTWKQKAEELESSNVTSDERTELLALRKEVKQLRVEKEILKKASAFFAKEMK